MNLRKENIIGLPVYTKNKQYLGKIFDFELNAENQVIVKYFVSSGDLIKKLVKNKELAIGAEQVISVTDKKMIVEDTLTYGQEAIKLPMEKSATAV